jgi:hypothetical protein
MTTAQYDVVVIGSGASGLTCATVAQQKGLRCLVLEKSALLGGTTAYSGGGVWIAGNPHMHQSGASDSRVDAKAYLSAVLGNHYDELLIEAFLDSGPEMVSYMEENTQVRFFSIPLSDYRPEFPGAKLGRTMLTQEYDGRALGGWLRKLRLPLPGYVAFGSMQADPQHLGKLKQAFRSWEGFRFSAGRFAAFLRDLLQYRRGANLANGNALVGRPPRNARPPNAGRARRWAWDATYRRKTRSGPLSDRMCAGGPRVTNNSASAASTSSLRNRRATGRARHSLLASSMIDRMRNLRPSCVRPSTKS